MNGGSNAGPGAAAGPTDFSGLGDSLRPGGSGGAHGVDAAGPGSGSAAAAARASKSGKLFQVGAGRATSGRPATAPLPLTQETLVQEAGVQRPRRGCHPSRPRAPCCTRALRVQCSTAEPSRLSPHACRGPRPSAGPHPWHLPSGPAVHPHLRHKAVPTPAPPQAAGADVPSLPRREETRSPPVRRSGVPAALPPPAPPSSPTHPTCAHLGTMTRCAVMHRLARARHSCLPCRPGSNRVGVPTRTAARGPACRPVTTALSTA